MKKIQTPISDDVVNDLKVGDKISLSGLMYCGRDAVLPKLANSIENDDTEESFEVLLREAVMLTFKVLLL